MTLNRRLATAAPAIVHRIINRSKPRVFRPVSPLKNGSIEAAVIFNKLLATRTEDLTDHGMWMIIAKDRSCLAAQN